MKNTGTYRIEGVDASGKRITRVVTADSKTEALAEAKTFDVFGVRATPQTALSEAFSRERFSELPKKQIAELVRYLAFSAESGMAEIDSIRNFHATTDHRPTQVVLSEIEASILAGRSMADALDAQEHRFGGSLLADVYRAASRTGTTVEALRALAESLDRAQRLKSTVKKAVVYPLIQMSLTMAVFAFLLLFIIPKLAETLEDVAGEGAELPLATRLMVGTADFLGTRWFELVIGLVATIFCYRRLAQTQSAGEVIDRIKLSLPKLGAVSRGLQMTQTIQLIGVLLSAGLPAPEVFATARRTSDNRWLGKAWGRVSDRIVAGTPPASALAQQAHVLDQSTVQLMKLSDSGIEDPGAPWISRSDQSAEESERKAHNLTEMIQPAVALLSGVMLVVMMLAVITPTLAMQEAIRNAAP